MADPTQEQIDAEKRAMLEAIAAKGTKARTEVENALAANKAAQEASMQGAMADAMKRDASPEMLAAMQQTLAQRAAPGAKFLDTIKGVNQTYFDSLKPAASIIPDTASEVMPLTKFYVGMRDGAAGGRGGRGGGGGGGGRRHGGGRGGGGGGSGNHQYWWDWYYENGLNKQYGGGKEGKAAFKNDIKTQASQGFTGPKGRNWTPANSPGWVRRQKLASIEAPGSERWAAGNFAPPPQARAVINKLNSAAQAGAKPGHVQGYLNDLVKSGHITRATAKWAAQEYKRTVNKARRGR